MKARIKNIFDDHAQSIFLLLACLGLLCTLFYFTVIRGNRVQQALDQKLKEIKLQLARQQALSPLYDDLQKKYALTIPGIQTLPEKVPLSKKETGNFDIVFREMVHQCDLTLVALKPDIHSILSDEGFLNVDLTTSGEYRNFKQLLMKIGQLPFLAAIDQFRIERKAEKNPLELYLKLRLVRE